MTPKQQETLRTLSKAIWGPAVVPSADPRLAALHNAMDAFDIGSTERQTLNALYPEASGF